MAADGAHDEPEAKKNVCSCSWTTTEDSLELLGRSLKRAGYGVVDVASAAEAVKAAHGRQCHLVVSDIGLPDRDGYSLMRELREQYGLRGIALSGFVRVLARAKVERHELDHARPALLPPRPRFHNGVQGWQSA